ncbi:MAG: FYVE zinc finger domain-containing protein [Acidimicrobiales bacterium]
MSNDSPTTEAATTGRDRDASSSSATALTPTRRYRCTACGNLTRFSVVTTRRTREFHHFSVEGELTLDEVEVLDETVEEVSCRWCGNGHAIESIEAGDPHR